MDTTTVNRSSQLICAHTAWMPLLLIGPGWFFITGWFPPLEPGLDTSAVQAMYVADRTSIRIGVTILAFASVFWWTFSAAIAGQLRRMEGIADPIWSRVQMASASGTVVVIMLAAYFVLAAAYRADMPAENIQLFHDMAWLLMIGGYPPGFLQNLAIGVCILGNKSEQQPYPRWIGYGNLWVAILFLPGALLPFFHDGPFAWNGLIGFWLVAFFFFAWILIMWRYTVKAIKNQEK